MLTGAVAVKAVLGVARGGALWNHDFDLSFISNHLSGRNLFIFDFTLLDLLSLAIRHVIVMNKTVLMAELRRLTLYQYAASFSQEDNSFAIAKLMKDLQLLSECRNFGSLKNLYPSDLVLHAPSSKA